MNHDTKFVFKISFVKIKVKLKVIFVKTCDYIECVNVINFAIITTKM